MPMKATAMPTKPAPLTKLRINLPWTPPTLLTATMAAKAPAMAMTIMIIFWLEMPA
ncbi:hypothetical protein D3C87_1942380 [compost metagenome]